MKLYNIKHDLRFFKVESRFTSCKKIPNLGKVSAMYAIFKNGGKQYKVAQGDILLLDKLGKEPKDKLEFSEVLALHNGKDLSIGTPFVKGAKIQAEVINEGRGKKVIAFKKRRRKDSKTKRGFRRDFTRVRIVAIAG